MKTTAKILNLGLLILATTSCTSFSGGSYVDNMKTGPRSVVKGDVPTEMEQRRVVSDLPEYHGPKMTIGVGEFENQSGRSYHLRDNMKTMLESALSQCGRFDVLDRTTLKNNIMEIGLARSGSANGNPGAVQAGRLKAAVYMAHGTITAINEGTTKSAGGVRVNGRPLVIGGESTTISMTIKVTDTSSGSIVIQRDIVGKAKRGSTAANVWGQVLGITFAHDAKNPIEEATQDCVVQLVDTIAREMETVMAEAERQQNLRASVHKVYPDHSVALDQGLGTGIQIGQQFEVAGEIDELGLPLSEPSLVKVIFVGDRFSKCELLSGPAPREKAPARLVSR